MSILLLARDHPGMTAGAQPLEGWGRWWANLYNESHLLFAFLTVGLIVAIALVTAMLSNLLLSRIGIDLKSRVLAER